MAAFVSMLLRRWIEVPACAVPVPRLFTAAVENSATVYVACAGSQLPYLRFARGGVVEEHHVRDRTGAIDQRDHVRVLDPASTVSVIKRANAHSSEWPIGDLQGWAVLVYRGPLMLRSSLICFALSGVGACVKPTTTVAPHSSYDLYNLCGEAKADGVCASSVEHAPLVDTNLSAHPHGILLALS